MLNKSNVRKMQGIIISVLSIAFCFVESWPAAAPQDFQTAALMLAGQIKEVAENGAAARDEKEFEFMGAKVRSEGALGFGDAMKMPGRRRRRDIDSQALGAGNSISNKSDYSSESEMFDSKEAVNKEQRRKRAASRDSSSQSSSSRFQSSSSSSSSSTSSSSSSSSSGSNESD